MKKIMMLIAVLCMSVNLQANEQGDYDLIGLSYENLTLSANNGITFDNDKSSLGMNGFGLEYAHGIRLSKLPMFLEIGGKFNMVFSSLSEWDYIGKYKVKASVNEKLVQILIPVSYSYKVSVAEKCYFIPYLGLDFRFNVSGSSTTKVSVMDSGYSESEKETVNWFNKNDMNGSTFNRFQLGWHIGARLEYSHVFLGLKFGTDFLHIWKEEEYHIGTRNFTVALGYRF